jgi:hypothetical protein
MSGDDEGGIVLVLEQPHPAEASPVVQEVNLMSSPTGSSSFRFRKRGLHRRQNKSLNSLAAVSQYTDVSYYSSDDDDEDDGDDEDGEEGEGEEFDCYTDDGGGEQSEKYYRRLQRAESRRSMQSVPSVQSVQSLGSAFTLGVGVTEDMSSLEGDDVELYHVDDISLEEEEEEQQDEEEEHKGGSSPNKKTLLPPHHHGTPPRHPADLHKLREILLHNRKGKIPNLYIPHSNSLGGDLDDLIEEQHEQGGEVSDFEEDDEADAIVQFAAKRLTKALVIQPQQQRQPPIGTVNTFRRSISCGVEEGQVPSELDVDKAKHFLSQLADAKQEAATTSATTPRGNVTLRNRRLPVSAAKSNMTSSSEYTEVLVDEYGEELVTPQRMSGTKARQSYSKMRRESSDPLASAAKSAMTSSSEYTEVLVEDDGEELVTPQRPSGTKARQSYSKMRRESSDYTEVLVESDWEEDTPSRRSNNKAARESVLSYDFTEIVEDEFEEVSEEESIIEVEEEEDVIDDEEEKEVAAT